MAHSHGCWQETSTPHLVGLSIGLLEYPHDHWLLPEQVNQESKEGAIMPVYDIALEVRHHHFCLVLFIRNKSLSLVHSQEEGNWLYLLKGVSLNLWIYFKPPQREIKGRQRELQTKIQV